MRRLCFSLIPKNCLSAVFGRLAALKLPVTLNRLVLRTYARHFGVNLDEAQKELSEFPSLAEFFVRDLKPWVRPTGEGVVSPVDGKLTEFGKIEEGRLLQVKGKYYRVADLLRDEALAEKYRDGFFLTFYLAPGDYHHIHAPVDGRIKRAIHIEGSLWPVNRWSVECIDELFTVNERVITLLESSSGTVAVVKVGATNVGSISLTYTDVKSNRPPYLRFRRRSQVHQHELAQEVAVKKGERLGTFHLGSTVVLLFEANCFTPGTRCAPGVIRYGETISAEKR